ncbi:uncharacterized protein BDW70DRAFT_14526 [Aspergillus foveolatus]|uniref:uncharacterized protein n=1 Tax=Aspergillus foveolatus TaxID=210207 RepID=UPI003CCE12F2
MDKTSRFTGQSCIYVAFLASKCFPCPVNTCGLFSSTRSCKVLFLLLLCCCLRHCAALLSLFALDHLSLCLLSSVLHCHCRFRERSQLSNGLLCSVNLAPRAVIISTLLVCTLASAACAMFRVCGPVSVARLRLQLLGQAGADRRLKVFYVV